MAGLHKGPPAVERNIVAVGPIATQTWPYPADFTLKTAFRRLSSVLPGFDNQPPAVFTGYEQTYPAHDASVPVPYLEWALTPQSPTHGRPQRWNMQMHDETARQILDRTLAALTRAVESLSAPASPRPANDFDAADSALCGTPKAAHLVPGRQAEPDRDRPDQGGRPRPRHSIRQHQALRHGLAGQQCPALGRTRHGQIVTGQVRPCRPWPHDPESVWAAQADRNSSRRHQFSLPALDEPCLQTGRRRASSCFATTCHSTMTTPPTNRSRQLSTAALKDRPDNALLYATSNRRHLLPRDMMENERSTAINPSEAVEEKVSLV